MKLRTTYNSIRIRVRKSELLTLQKEHRIEESIRFPSNTTFKFAVEIRENIEHIQASLDNHNLVLSISRQEAAQWINSNQVGIEANLELEDKEQLHVLIEKDFPCLDRENEDKSDTFWDLASTNPESC